MIHTVFFNHRKTPFIQWQWFNDKKPLEKPSIPMVEIWRKKHSTHSGEKSNKSNKCGISRIRFDETHKMHSGGKVVGRRNNSNWMPDQTRRTIRKKSFRIFSLAAALPSPVQLSSYLSRLNRGEQLLTKVNTSLPGKVWIFWHFWRWTETKLIAFLIWKDFFSFCWLLQD